MKHRLGLGILLGAAMLFMVPAVSSAQSAIVGLLTDDSGGVLPGVSVEVTSPAMIEGTKTTVTDSQGRYRFEAMRPGVYKLSFSLTGFGTVVREGVNLPSNFTATVNAEMKVGSLEETINVSGTAPQVDVQQASRTTVIARDVIDSLPISRNVMGLGVLAGGVRPTTPDMGGMQTTEQVGLRARGLGGFDGEQQVEGMSVQSYEGGSQSFMDDTLNSEMTVTTAAIPADTGGGGIRLNMILKDGGNQFSGSAFMGGTRGIWVQDNIDDELRARNLTVPNGIDHLEAFTGSLGGPIREGQTVVHPLGPASVDRDDDPERAEVHHRAERRHGEGHQRLVRPQRFHAPHVSGLQEHQGGRLPRALVAQEGAHDWRGHRHSRRRAARPEERAPRDRQHDGDRTGDQQLALPGWLLVCGVLLERRSAKRFPCPARRGGSLHPAWYATAQTNDTALNKNFPDRCMYVTGCTAWNTTRLQRQESVRNVMKASASYVTGSHNIKVGIENTFGPGRQRKNTRNGHLTVNYVNNQPTNVIVYNNPTISPAYVAYDVGLFAQDSWTLKRLTVNPGIRVVWIETGMYESSMAAGRFVPARFIPEEKGLINFGADYSPRLERGVRPVRRRSHGTQDELEQVLPELRR